MGGSSCKATVVTLLEKAAQADIARPATEIAQLGAFVAYDNNMLFRGLPWAGVMARGGY